MENINIPDTGSEAKKKLVSQTEAVTIIMKMNKVGDVDLLSDRDMRSFIDYLTMKLEIRKNSKGNAKE